MIKKISIKINKILSWWYIQKLSLYKITLRKIYYSHITKQYYKKLPLDGFLHWEVSLPFYHTFLFFKIKYINRTIFWWVILCVLYISMLFGLAYAIGYALIPEFEVLIKKLYVPDVYEIYLFSKKIIPFIKQLDLEFAPISTFFLLNDIKIFVFLFFYLFNTIQATVFAYRIGVNGVYVVGVVAVCVLWLIELTQFNRFIILKEQYLLSLVFMDTSLFPINFNFELILSELSYSFLFLTTTIALCASFYTLVYFKNEPNADRFILLIHWFVLSMSLLVLSSNGILLYLGWELIGFTSFLLINFWTLRRGTLKAAFKAFTFNKFSDLCLLIFVLGMGSATNSFNTEVWTVWFDLNTLFTNYELTALCVLLIAASSIKSAQIIGHLWLPDSMEAPIPASALIHSATLVSAGVYLLLKFNFLLFFTGLMPFVSFLGIITAAYGAVVSASQTDLKKLLAYSTISHCGFLFFTIGLNNLRITIIYLCLHGFFKALTFFCVGNLLKCSKGYQDSRKMGTFFILLPVDSILLVICAMNLAALPFTLGFYYKHYVQILLQTSIYFYVTVAFAVLSMLCGVIYFYRLVYYALFDIKKNQEVVYNMFTLRTLRNDLFTTTPHVGYFWIFFILFFVYMYISKKIVILDENYLYRIIRAATLHEPNAEVNYLSQNIYTLLKYKTHFLDFSFFYNTLFCAIFFIIYLVNSRKALSQLYLKMNTIPYVIIFTLCLFVII